MAKKGHGSMDHESMTTTNPTQMQGEKLATEKYKGRVDDGATRSSTAATPRTLGPRTA